MRRLCEVVHSKSTAWISGVLLFLVLRVGGLVMSWGDSVQDDWKTSRAGVSNWGAALLWFFLFGVAGVIFALIITVLTWVDVDPNAWLAWMMVGFLALSLGGGIGHGLAFLLGVERAWLITEMCAILCSLSIALILTALP